MLMSASLLCCSCCSLTEEDDCLSGVPSELGADASAESVGKGMEELAGRVVEGVRGGEVGRSVTSSACCCREGDAGSNDGAVAGRGVPHDSQPCRN